MEPVKEQAKNGGSQKIFAVQTETALMRSIFR